MKSVVKLGLAVAWGAAALAPALAETDTEVALVPGGQAIATAGCLMDPTPASC